MQNPIRIGSFARAAAIGLAAAMLATGADAAVIVARATLATPLAEPRQAELGGITWTCEGVSCQGTVPNSGSRRPTAMIACRALVQAVGPVAEFQRAGVEMSSGNLRHCNNNAGAQN